MQAVYSRMWAGESKKQPLYNAINCCFFFSLSFGRVQHMSRQRKQRLTGTENVYFVVNLSKEMLYILLISITGGYRNFISVTFFSETFFFKIFAYLFSTLYLHPEHLRWTNNFTHHSIEFRQSVQDIKRSDN